MEHYRDLELTLVSGRDIGPGSWTGRPKAYAKVSLKGIPESAQKSKVDTTGGTNPIWNLALNLTIPDSSVREAGVEVVVKLYYKRILGNVLVGEVKIPIPVLFECGIRASTSFRVVPTGSLNISYTFGERLPMPNHPTFPRLPTLRRLPSANLVSLQDSENTRIADSVYLPDSEDADLVYLPDSEDADLVYHQSIDTGNTSPQSSEGTEYASLSGSDAKDFSSHYGGRRQYVTTQLASLDLGAKRKDEGVSMLRSTRHSVAEAASVFRPGTSSMAALGIGTSFWKDPREKKRMNEDRYKRFLKDFILFCSVFPVDYEFTKDVLVWQWIARRLIELGEDEEMEEVMCTEECVDTLVDKNYIIPSGYDYVLDQTKYKIGDKMTTDGKYLDSRQSHHDPTKVEHLSLTFKEIDHAKVKQYSRLHTLVIHDCYEADHLPSDLFSGMKSLKILNLSRTSVVELPSSVEDLKELRFLDMSNTPLVWLPESVCSLTHLQTLKLDGCVQLEGLPEGTSNLINLRHLILDVVRQLESMPVGLGKLSNLRTLSAFLVSEEDGYSVRELKDMNKLRGTFRLLNLENVKTKEEASEACLSKKVDLKKIELQWSDTEDERIPLEEEILETLKPGVGIQELKILFYSGGVLPSWICDPSFEELVTISLYKCRYCVNLSSLGELPSLKHLSIIENKEVVEIGSSLCRKQRYRYHVAFSKLEKLTFESMYILEKWTGFAMGEFPSLRHLIMEYCPKLEKLPFLLCLHPLTHLEIRYCPELSLSPETALPPCLQSLMIKESPRLKEWCSHENWSRIADVPTVYFDHVTIHQPMKGESDGPLNKSNKGKEKVQQEDISPPKSRPKRKTQVPVKLQDYQVG